MSIFVTGDIHASYDIAKLSESCFDTTGLNKDDYVIVCGDFGLVWNNSASEQYWLRWLDARPFTTLFVDGNHEGFALLNSLPETTWNGGRVHQVANGVFHLQRGQMFDIDGYRIFTMGGAASSEYDREHRVLGETWFTEEVPNEQERATAIETLNQAGWNCDLVITHCAPTSAAKGISKHTDRLEIHPMDEYTDWLQGIQDRLTYTHWFCGHYHIDAQIQDKTTALYNRIAKLADPTVNADSKNEVITSLPYQLLPEPTDDPKPPIPDYASELEDQDSLEIDLE
ncbi:metallophosphoesterase [uncultured Senegalimassilia sp.]|uniref:metallophosphoesterase family protein n=1 Tax=uncultured Senegalimassilia sp. TaxID=1714350 RepID=UPI0025E1367D|nr:metallophosphoesterase [uncultured Senegalimassilia sp.]